MPVRVKKTRQNKNLEHRFWFYQNRCSSLARLLSGRFAAANPDHGVLS